MTFLGVRGTRPTPLAQNLGFGGNTTCLEISSGQHDRLFVDAGTGISRAAGIHEQEQIQVLLTHFHSDHIQGLPFFAPLFDRRCHLIFWSGLAPDAARRALEGQLAPPYSPAMDFAAARRSYIEVKQQAFDLGSIRVHPFALNHPQGAWGYRVESDSAAIVHASDHEHGDPVLDGALLDHAQDADVLIYDSQYTDAEYASKKGWGHSTWREATRMACAARVKKLILFHHDPTHDDATISAIVDEARRHFEHTDAAREGATINV